MRSADLIAEQIDVAFRGGPLRDSGYVGRPLLGARSDGMVASPAYIAARGTPGTLQELASHDCVTSAHPSGRTTWRLAGPDGVEEEVQVAGRFSGNTAQALRKATRGRPRHRPAAAAMAGLDVQAGLLVPVLPQYQRTSQGLSVLYPSRRQLPLAVSAFIALVLEKLSSLETYRAIHVFLPLPAGERAGGEGQCHAVRIKERSLAGVAHSPIATI